MVKKLLLILAFPIFLFAKIQVTTYFPLETQFVKKIGKNEVEVYEITHRYSDNYSRDS